MTDGKDRFSEEEALKEVIGDILSEGSGAKKTPPTQPTEKKEKTATVQPSDYQKLVSDLAASKERYLRLFAEFENARKRNERERIEFVKYANEELITQFLNILDDLERSVEAAKTKHEDYDAFLKGIELVMAHVYDMLKKNNVKAIEAKGKIFDPHVHEPLMQEETDKAAEGTVLEELQKGYMLGDKVVRTAKVKVAKHKGDG